MGRKIPGKKHKGVKDPVKQQFKRNEILKACTNAPPSNPHIQEIPNSVIEMNRLRALAKSGNVKTKKTKKAILFDSGRKPRQPLPRVKQKSDESDEHFLWRMELATNNIIAEAKMEAKHEVTVKRGSSGMVESVIPSLPNRSVKPKKINTKTFKSELNTGDRKVKIERMKERRKLKLLSKKAKCRDDDVELERKKDFVKFGEVVHHPPHITARPRGVDKKSVEKPGRKTLLLKSILESGDKNKSMSDVKHIAEERQKVMAAYKAMKERNRIQAGGQQRKQW